MWTRFAGSSPSAAVQFNQHKICFKARSISVHTFLSLFQVAMATYIQNAWIATGNQIWAKTDQMSKKSSTLLDQNLGPCVDCTRGRGLLIIVRCENWADLGKFWGNGQMPNIWCRDEMQALVLTPRGRDKYFYRWICLEGTPMHIWTQRKKNTQPFVSTQYGFAGDFEKVPSHLQAWFVENVWLQWWPLLPPSNTCQGHWLRVDSNAFCSRAFVLRHWVLV